MNFLKTLLVYMSMTLAMGVQQTTPPDPAALPTPTPTAAVETAEAADATNAAVIATPVAAQTENAAPTMTPNAKYTKLQYKDKNNNVKKMQQRLIELGYLSKGDADGSFGYKTLNAVRAFQKANGLTVDGVAGKATLTHLYEDENVVANPSAATATPAPTATPKPTAKEAATTEDATEEQTAAEPEAEAETSVLIASWYKTNATVLLNGNSLVLLARSNGNVIQRKPTVYLHDNAVMICLNDLIEAAGEWTLIPANGAGCKLTIAGYEIELISTRATTGDTDSFTATVDGTAVEVSDGDVVYADGNWYCTAGFLEKTVGAAVVWDNDENTLVLRITDKAIAQSAD